MSKKRLNINDRYSQYEEEEQKSENSEEMKVTSQSVSQIQVQKSMFEDQLHKGMSLSEDQQELPMQEEEKKEENEEDVVPTTEKKDPEILGSELNVDDTSSYKLSTK